MLPAVLETEDSTGEREGEAMTSDRAPFEKLLRRARHELARSEECRRRKRRAIVASVRRLERERRERKRQRVALRRLDRVLVSFTCQTARFTEAMAKAIGALDRLFIVCSTPGDGRGSQISDVLRPETDRKSVV